MFVDTCTGRFKRVDRQACLGTFCHHSIFRHKDDKMSSDAARFVTTVYFVTKMTK